MRSGTGMLDLLVSFTLLVTLISVSTPLVVRHGCLLKSHRNYRLALDELSNQMERLAALTVDQLPSALEQISPSKFISDRLPGAKIASDSEPVELGGRRITLKLSWNDVGRREAPVTLAAWIMPLPPGRGEAEGDSP